ncbi:polysaccharide deacetylase family protein [Niallia sp. 03133]|uniref:polysaccharide deacetylase family protein n=1 Tax=Niallia sp. 03133 TaxID=3458060 RepID=UPI004043AA7C
MINFLVIGITSIFLLFVFYAVIPTVFIRMTGKGVEKRIQSEAIALTFDDGPHPIYTVQLLDLLKKYGVKASFFVVGSKVEKHPDIIQRMHEEGHAIGIHHYKHVSSWFISPFRLRDELKRTEKAIMDCTKEKAALYRPPWGHLNLFSLFVSKGYKVVIWSHIFGDWRIEKCQNGLLDSLRSATEKGSIFVLHDCGQTVGAEIEAPKYMLEKLEIYLDETTNKGTKFVTLKNI